MLSVVWNEGMQRTQGKCVHGRRPLKEFRHRLYEFDPI